MPHHSLRVDDVWHTSLSTPCLGVYNPATQDGHSPVLLTSPAWSVPASPIPHSQDWLSLLTMGPNQKMPTSLLWPQLVIHLQMRAVSTMIVYQKRRVPSAGFPDNWRARLIPIPSTMVIPPSPPPPPLQRLLPRPDHCVPHMVGCPSRPLLQTCMIPHPLNHWGLCHCLWALSSVLRLSKNSNVQSVTLGFSLDLARPRGCPCCWGALPLQRKCCWLSEQSSSSWEGWSA